ncbi:MAG: hypothetical protein GXO26_04305 [Crenarchaeota archaeon]|nr:hypothetical protein [Thermoproteota archaeon]
MDLIEEIRYILGLSDTPPPVPAVEVDERVKASPRLVPHILAQTPPNISTILLGAPGIGKTSSVLEFARALAEATGRELISTIGIGDPHDIEVLIDEVRSRPEKYIVFSYIHGPEITRTTYAVPATVLDREARSQRWLPPPQVALVAVTLSMKRRVESTFRDTSLIDEVIIGQLPLYPLGRLRELLRELLRTVPLGVLFIDEALQAYAEFVEHYMSSLVGERKWANTYISPLVWIVLSSNPSTYVKTILNVAGNVPRRLRWIEVTTPSASELANYVRERLRRLGVEPNENVISMVERAEPYLTATVNDVEKSIERGHSYPTPAGWLRLAMALQAYGLDRDRAELEATLYLGPDAGKHVARLIRELNFNIMEILEKPLQYLDTLSRFDERCRIASLVTRLVKERQDTSIVEKYVHLLEILYVKGMISLEEAGDRIIQLLREVKGSPLEREIILKVMRSSLYVEAVKKLARSNNVESK